MKRIPLVLFLLFLLLSSCEKSIDRYFEKKMAARQLPPVSCEGENLFGCLVNGEKWLPYSLTDLSFDARIERDSSFSLRTLNRYKRYDMIVIYVENISGPGTYALGQGREIRYTHHELQQDDYVDYYCINDMFGELHISRIDTVQGIICGTFSFDAVNRYNSSDTVRIREARFDAEFHY